MTSLLPSLDIAGLPAHPLLVHGVVVLLPLSALALIALVLVPRWRERFGVLTLAGLLVATVLAFVAKEAGEELAARVGEPADHALWGDRLPLVALALLLVGGGWLASQVRLWSRLRHRGTPAPSEPARKEGVGAMVASILAVLLAMAAIAVTVVVGHSGATATWGARAGSGTGSGAASSPSITSRDGSYTLAQEAEHNTAASCWSAINGDVYDLTGWIQNHPGGPNAIRSICGTDGSMGFNNRHASTPDALAKLPEFKIGTLLQ